MVYVQEKRFGDLGMSLEYSELDGFGASANAHYANLRGEGKLVGVEYGLGERFKYWGFHYSDPLFLKTNQAFHIQVTGSSADRDIFSRSETPISEGATISNASDLPWVLVNPLPCAPTISS